MSDLVARRMHRQHLWGAPMGSVDEVIRHFGAMQAQEFGPAKWGIAQRLSGVTDADVHAAFNAGTLVRTHILRPTWHFVHAADIRWMLAASAPRVHAVNAYYYRRTGVDEQIATRSRAVFERVLGDGQQLTRKELATALAAAGMPATGVPLAYVIMRAELDGVLISGPMVERAGVKTSAKTSAKTKQHTYTLLDVRVPPTPVPQHDDALAELTRRYFGSRGPATVKDYATWASLTATQARRGLAMLGTDAVSERISSERMSSERMSSERISERTYWSLPESPSTARPDGAGSVADLAVAPPGPVIDLLQDYDEYVVGYFDSRDVIMRRDGPAAALAAGRRAMLLDGQLIGFWRHVVTEIGAKPGSAAVAADLPSGVEIETILSRPFTTPEAASMQRAADRFAAFLGIPVTWR